MSNKLKWFAPLVLATIGIVAIFAAIANGGNDGDNNQAATTATEDVQKVTIDDPRVQELVSMVRSGEIKNSDQLQVQAFRLGFTAEEVDSVISVIGVHTGLNLQAAPSPSPSSTATESATASATATPSPPPDGKNDLKGTGTKPSFVTDASHGDWTIQGTDRLAENPVVAGWLSRLRDPDPANWKTFPNIPNEDVPEFRVVNGTEVPDGVEYGTYDSPYCSSHPCDVPVGAWEYRLITGDYDVMGYECRGDSKTGHGCLLLLINVMDQSVTFRDQDVDNGFTLRGRYWNGDALEWGVWGLVSHASANMLNMPTFAREGEVLNSGDPGNSGANCGIPQGCDSVDARVIVVAGDTAIAVLETKVTKP